MGLSSAFYTTYGRSNECVRVCVVTVTIRLYYYIKLTAIACRAHFFVRFDLTQDQSRMLNNTLLLWDLNKEKDVFLFISLVWSEI